MISRYTRPEMAALWSDESRFTRYLEVEFAVLRAQEELGILPPGSLPKKFFPLGALDVQRIQALEEKTRHELIAFLEFLGEFYPGAPFHLGLTSSDVQDTGLALQLRDSARLIQRGLTKAVSALEDLARRHVFTACLGRTHGMAAEPTSFGLKCAVWFGHLKRAGDTFSAAGEAISVGKLSGPVGTLAHNPPEVEETALWRLGLEVEPVATQVVQRDRHAQFVLALAQLGAAVENIAQEIRHLSRTEVAEVAEGFAKGQKGSSAMPHKKNPISSENLIGVGRLLRSYCVPALENISLLHERDISHSSVERVILPDACALADYALARLEKMLLELEVYPDRMKANIEAAGDQIFSGSLLQKLASKGMSSRSDIYLEVQSMAFKSRAEGTSFKSQVQEAEFLRTILSEDDLQEAFSLSRHLSRADYLIERALGSST